MARIIIWAMQGRVREAVCPGIIVESENHRIIKVGKDL